MSRKRKLCEETKVIITTLNGQLYFGADIANDIAVHALEKLKKANTPPRFDLTNKEKETLKHIYCGPGDLKFWKNKE